MKEVAIGEDRPLLRIELLAMQQSRDSIPELQRVASVSGADLPLGQFQQARGFVVDAGRGWSSQDQTGDALGVFIALPCGQIVQIGAQHCDAAIQLLDRHARVRFDHVSQR